MIPTVFWFPFHSNDGTQGETDKAIRSYSRAVEMAPELAAPRVNLGAQLLQSGRLPEAEVVRSATAVHTILRRMSGGRCLW